MGKINRFLCQIIILPILAYQYLIRPVLKPCCRYYPSCSDYSLQAINMYGIVKGLILTGCRILRCHPWAKGGYDPVLSNKEKP